jgi:transcriptional regulator with PAS, ATPase and Fis domain
MQGIEPPSRALRRWLATRPSGEALLALSELNPDIAVFAVDADRNIVLWSQGATRLLGYTAEEALQKPCLETVRCTACMVGCGIAEHSRVSGVSLQLFKKGGGPVQVQKSGQAFWEGKLFAGGIEILMADKLQEVSIQPELAAFHGILSKEPVMQRLFQLIRNVAATDTTVLVRGESGTGKELVARAIHQESARKKGPFVAVNCAAFTATLLESALFGHVKGAFTGATADHPGIFAQAHGGTLFLDEVAELPLELQARLLRVLQEKTVQPVGGTRAIPVDVRIVAATHQALREEVRLRRFREDLMYRLRVVPIFLPPLRERPLDIELLLWYFIERENHKPGHRQIRRLDPEAKAMLLSWKWPGNIRELENVVACAFAVGEGDSIKLADLPPEFRETPGSTQTTDEARQLQEALDRYGGNVGEAAASLGISRPTFWRKRKKHGI